MLLTAFDRRPLRLGNLIGSRFLVPSAPEAIDRVSGRGARPGC